MSDFSVIKNKFEGFLEKLAGKVPEAAQPAVQDAANEVHAAISDAASAAGVVLSDAVPTLEAAAVAAVPAEFKPFASLVIQLGVGELMSRVQKAA